MKESHVLPGETGDAGEAFPGSENLPDTFDRFRIIEKIGEGGCGVVYRAEQLKPVRREVALKVIKLGMDTRSVIARFEAERQALAIMDHAGIAKVFDGGATTAGRPFFVMELARGVPITAYCQQHALDLEPRLRLFIELCQALQHAHQKGIIHRDVKPSNVLVVEENGTPRPKVIDFGVARATSRQRLADQTIYTAFDQFVGTPAYMSPEQAGLTGEDVDTRSDIYSLGVLLYELLVGAPPFDPQRLRTAALDEVCRIIREEEPVKPSTRLKLGLNSKSETRNLKSTSHSAISSDLDWIVMKALEKNCARRYDTVSDFAHDIEQYLNGEPVSARPPSVFYRLQKTILRSKLMFGAGTAVLLAFLAGAALSAWQLITERQAHRAAMDSDQQVRPITNTTEKLSRLLHEVLPGIEKDATSPGALLRLSEALIARERFAEAEDAAREAITILTNRHQPGDSRTLGFVTLRLVEALSAQYNWGEAEASARDSVALWRRETSDRQQLFAAVHWYAIICRNQGKWAQAEPLQREAVQLCEEIQAGGETLDGYSSALCSQLRCWLGLILLRQHKFAEAEPMLLAGYGGVRGRTDQRDILHEQKSLKLLAELCDATDRPDEAAKWRQKLAEFQHRAKQAE